MGFSRIHGILCVAVLLHAGVSAADSLSTTGSPSPASVFDIGDYVTGIGEITDLRFLPDGKVVIAEKSGVVRIGLPPTPAIAGRFPVDNTHNEKGLLGVEVHPSFASNRTLFFYYSLA